jgi:hypothetical protein
MQPAIAKVKNLEKFIRKYGEDKLFSRSISKMFDYRIRKYSEEIKKMDVYLSRFEKTYKKKSSSFFREFSAGLLGDDLDFVEWASFYQMRERLIEKKAELEGLNA